MTSHDLPRSDACERNKEPILGVLRASFASSLLVLEIGSGTGQHAVHFSRHLPHLQWQPSELAENLPSLNARILLEGPPNLRPACALDVRVLPWPTAATGADAAFTANTLHIMPWSAVEACFRGIGELLPAGGVFCAYGPFRFGGVHTSASNAAFDHELRARDAAMGVRDFEALQRLAGQHGLTAVGDYPMPANNRTLVWQSAR
jgi:hypothetical protein